jgi:TPR repeat protein
MNICEMAPRPLPEAGLSAETACGEDLYRLGLAYSEGIRVERDLVAAHKWFNLAAVRGSTEAKLLRAEIAEMLDPVGIKSALQAARDWLRRAA